MNINFFSEVLTRKPFLLKAMLQFNTPQQEMSVPKDMQELADYGVDVDSLWEDVKGYFKETENSNLSPNYWDFSDETKRLLLLDEHILQQLVLYFGVLLNAKEIAQSIEKTQVLAIKQELGEKAYSYALNRAQFQMKNTPLFENILTTKEEQSLTQRVISQGVLALASCIHEWSPELQENMAKKLGRILEKHKNNTLHDIKSLNHSFFSTLSPETKRYIWFTLKKILSKELSPQWAQYFD